MIALRSGLGVVIVTLALVVLTAAPAAADPAGPTDFRAEVIGLSPPVEGVRAEILGGDAFLELTVTAGRSVLVEGYQGEPYLRFGSDGRVEQNRLSSAAYLNDDRDGIVTIPAEVQAAGATTPPEWEQVADGGTFAWHDHRVHWMQDVGPGVPRGARVGGVYDPWRIPITVDGAPTEVQGTLVYAETVSPLPYLAMAVMTGGIVWWLGRRRTLLLPAGALVAASVAAVVVGLADFRSTPGGGGNPLAWALAAVALGGGMGSVLFLRHRAGVVLALAAVASLFSWALFRVQVVLKPVLPTDLPFAVDRASIAVAVGVSVAAGYLAVASGALALPDLDED